MLTAAVADTFIVPLLVRLLPDVVTTTVPCAVSRAPLLTVMVPDTVRFIDCALMLAPLWMTIDAAAALPVPLLTTGNTGADPGIVSASSAVGVPAGVQLAPLLKLSPEVPVHVRGVATRYGPTTGPPLGAPAGARPSVDASVLARPMFSRPLPRCELLSGSADRARRPTIVALLAPGSRVRSAATAPA